MNDSSNDAAKQAIPTVQEAIDAMLARCFEVVAWHMDLEAVMLAEKARELRAWGSA